LRSLVDGVNIYYCTFSQKILFGEVDLTFMKASG